VLGTVRDLTSHFCHILIYNCFSMERDSFEHVLDLIKDDQIFVSTGKRPQRPVKHQLAVFLLQVGGKLAQKTGDAALVAEGTVYLYCGRVAKALRRQRPDHLAWPGFARRDFIKHKCGEEHRFHGCIGSGDATFFVLAQKPRGIGG
jgi:hypothetical protein